MLVDGICQIPDPVYKFVGSIVCFYIPLCVMLLTYTLTVRLLAQQQQNLGGSKTTPSGGSSWSSGWLGQAPGIGKYRANNIEVTIIILLLSFTERRNTWKRLIKNSLPSTPNHAHSAASTDTELSALEMNGHELWLPESR